MSRTWTDARDGSVWMIEADPVERPGDGDPDPTIGDMSYTLRFSSQGGGIHRLVVDPEVASRVSELTSAELAEYLDEARSGGQL